MSSSESSPQNSEVIIAYPTPDEVYAAAIVLPIVAIITLAARWHQNKSRAKKIGTDDWLMLPSLLFLIGIGITLCIGVHGKAIGYPIPYQGNLSKDEQFHTLNPIISLNGKIQIAILILLVFASGFLKLSIICLYRRLFVVDLINQIFGWITWAAIVIDVAWMITCLIALSLTCGSHFSTNWGSVADKARYCLHSIPIATSFVITDAITNCLVWLMPIPMIWRLHMPWYRKLATAGILMLGSISVIASIIKCIVAVAINNGHWNPNVDQNLTTSTILYWCMIEAGIANIASNLPFLQGFCSKILSLGMFRSLRGMSGMSPATQSSSYKVRSKQRIDDEQCGLNDVYLPNYPNKDSGTEVNDVHTSRKVSASVIV